MEPRPTVKVGKVLLLILLWPLVAIGQGGSEAQLEVKLPPLLFVGTETLRAEFKGEVPIPSFLPPVERERPTLKLVDAERGLVEVLERPSPRPQSPGCAYRTAVGASVARILQGVEAAYKRGLYLYLKGERGRAEELFQGIVEDHPKTLYAFMSLYWLAEIALEEGELDRALGLLGRLRQEHPRSPYGDYALQAEAVTLVRMGRFREALEILPLAEERFPGSPLLPSFKLTEAIVRAKLGQWEECLEIARSLEGKGAFLDRALYLKGLAAFSLGKYREAQVALGDFLAENRGHPLYGNALCLLGLAKVNAGAIQGAAPAFEEYLRLYPEGPWAGMARMALVRVYLASGREGDALEHLEALRHRKDPWLAEALWEYAFFLRQEGRDSEALPVLQEILGLGPSPDLARRTHYLMGEILAKRGEFPRAAQAFAEASGGEGELGLYAALNQGLSLLHAGDPLGAKRALEELRGRLPSDHPLWDDLHFLLGQARLRLGDPEGAFEAFRAIRAPEGQEKALMAMALHYFRRGQWERALQWALKIKGGKGRLLEGLCLFNLKDYQGALEALSALKEEDLDPEGAKDALFYRGLSLYKLGRFQEAAQALGEFVGRYPADPLTPQALYWKGWALSRAGLWEGAEDAFLTLANDYPDHPLAPEAWLRVGDARYNRGLYDEAVLAYLKVKSLYAQSPFLPDALWGIVLSYFRAGKEDRFLLWADHLVRSYPGHPLAKRVMMLLGEYYEAKGDLEEAEASYRRILEAFPEADEARVPLGRILGRGGRKAEALEVLGQVKEEPYLWEALLEMARLTMEGDPHRGSLYLWRLVEEAPEEFATKAALLSEGLPPEEEMGLLLRFLGRFPSSPSAPYLMVRLGDLALEMGKGEEALGWFLKASENAQEEAFRARCELKAAQALMVMGKAQQALEQALKVLYLYPQQDEERALALVIAAQVYKGQGDLGKFEQACRRAQELSQADEVVEKVREVCGGQSR